MNALSAANLAQLKWAYFSPRPSVKPSRNGGREDAPATRGAKLLDTLSTEELLHLLRHHEDGRGISDKETWNRDNIDELLSFYGMLEVACAAALVEPSPDTRLRESALRHLSNPAVRRYYEVHYPLVNPRHLRERFMGNWVAVERDPHSRISGLFASLLDLDATLSTWEADSFLWMLDSGTRGDYDLDDVIDITRRPGSFARRLAAPTGSSDALHLALRGFETFLTFCMRLDSLLQQCEKTSDQAPLPIFQSTAWHQYGYWFNLLGEHFASKLNRALANFERVANASSESTEDRQEMRTRAEAVKAAVERLVNGSYGHAV